MYVILVHVHVLNCFIKTFCEENASTAYADILRKQCQRLKALTVFPQSYKGYARTTHINFVINIVININDMYHDKYHLIDSYDKNHDFFQPYSCPFSVSVFY